MQGNNSAVKAIGRIVFMIALAGLSVVLIALSTFNAYSLFNLVFPGDTIRAIAGVLLFDAALLVWLGVTVFNCDSTAQTAIAALATLGTFLAVLVLNWLALNLTGQTMVAVDRATWGMFALYAIEGAITWHLLWTVAHLMASPFIVAHINVTFKTNVLLAKAQHKADESMDKVADELAEQIGGIRHIAALRELANQSGLPSLTANGLTVTNKKAVKVVGPAEWIAGEFEGGAGKQATPNGNGNGASVHFTKPPNQQ